MVGGESQKAAAAGADAGQESWLGTQAQKEESSAKSHDSQTSESPWGACESTPLAPPPGFLIQGGCSEVSKFAFLTSFQVTVMLLGRQPHTRIEAKALGSNKVKFLVYYLLDVTSPTSYLTCLYLSFVICKMGMIIQYIMKIKWDNACEVLFPLHDTY